MEPRLKSGLSIKALVRRCDLAAIGVAMVARGDRDAGAILIKLNRRDTGCGVDIRPCVTALPAVSDCLYVPPDLTNF
jgi:hypothetical protein